MKLIFSALVLCVFTVPMARAGKTVLPDACGDDSVKFSVKTEKDQPAPAPPPTGKAQIILINDAKKWSARYGIDGAWVGANDGNSYFAAVVDPGERHLCVKYNIGALYPGSLKQESAMAASIVVEAGKIYYFQSTVGVAGGGGGGFVAPTMGANGQMSGGGLVQGGGGGMPVFGFGRVDDDTGKYRVKAWKLATWKTK